MKLTIEKGGEPFLSQNRQWIFLDLGCAHPACQGIAFFPCRSDFMLDTFAEKDHKSALGREKDAVNLFRTFFIKNHKFAAVGFGPGGVEVKNKRNLAAGIALELIFVALVKAAFGIDGIVGFQIVERKKALSFQLVHKSEHPIQKKFLGRSRVQVLNPEDFRQSNPGERFLFCLFSDLGFFQALTFFEIFELL